MPLFKARTRPRLTRLSTSSFRKKERQMCMYILAAALLLIASVSILQLVVGRTSAHAAHDAKHTRKRASETEDVRVNRQKDVQKYIEAEKATSRRKWAEMVNSGNLPKDWTARNEGRSRGEGVAQFLAETGRETSLNKEEVDDFELNEAHGYTGNARMYQGQLLEDMDKFEKGQVTEDSNKHQLGADEVPEKMKKEMRKLGYKEDKGRELLDKIKRAPEAPKGSIRAAIQEALERRNGVFYRDFSMGLRGRFEEEGNPLYLNLGETNHNPKKSAEAGMPSLGRFKEFFDNLKVKHGVGVEALDKNVQQQLQKDMKVEDAAMLDEGSRLSPWDILKKREAGTMDSLNLPNVNESKGNIELSSMSAQKTAEVHNPDPVNVNALAMEEKMYESKQFEFDKQLMKEEQVEEEKEPENESAVKENEDDEHDNLIQWGFYPNLSQTLKFSKFLSAFFEQERCSLRIFMAWTTAPWAYTTRHQRALESLFHFHPDACIVVFTETIDFKFFGSWVKEGYKIAVTRPNLEELLGETAAIDFAYVWYEWRITNLFYIHYTELLRLAALYKYGGVWLDMDVILARPLPKLHNVLGSTVSENGEWVLNGAFMSFDKSSPFLKACIEEYVATYDETSLGWNGADLLNRVASNATTKKGGKTWLEDHLQVLEPAVFFPLSRHKILRYFSMPTTYHEKKEQERMLLAILNESHATHLWNSLTGHHVLEVGSLVEKILNQFCMRCTDIL